MTCAWVFCVVSYYLVMSSNAFFDTIMFLSAFTNESPTDQRRLVASAFSGSGTSGKSGEGFQPGL